MARCVFIVQGEGRGHLSQSVAMGEYLEEAGHNVEAVFVGTNPRHPLPPNYLGIFHRKLTSFSSPYFLRTPNKKGIYVVRTILYNLLRSAAYWSEVRRIRRIIDDIGPDVVFNFYDVVGALALRRISPEITRIGIGHHFYLHLDGYRCGGGNQLHKQFLRLHTRMVMRSCDEVLALSFRDVQGGKRINVVPPLIRKAFREASYEAGARYLVYLLNEGFVTELNHMARTNPGFRADLFSELPESTPVPPGINLHAIDDSAFLEKMASCRGLITTAGFDTIAEAAYMGIPLGVVPVHNHFEQRCNSRDIVRSGLGSAMEGFTDESLKQLKKVDNTNFREWVDQAGKRIINYIQG